MDSASQKKSDLFDELVNEVNHLNTGDHLSLGLRNELENFPLDARKEIVNRVKQGCSPLFCACREGLLEIAEYLIHTCGADIEQKGTYYNITNMSTNVGTPLWCAAFLEKLSIVKLLIHSGADINAVSDSGSTPIMSACSLSKSMSNFQVVKDLVRYGADINKQDYDGRTCLMHSLYHPNLCKFLLKKGADVNAKDIKNRTVLHCAIEWWYSLKIVKLLLKYGADYTIKSRDGNDALQTASLFGTIEIFKYLTAKISYSPERIANGLELLGAKYQDENISLELWKDALEIRDKNGLHPKQPVMPLQERYHKQREFETLDELMAISEDFLKFYTQILLIFERILGTHHQETINKLEFLGNECDFPQSIELLRYAFEIKIEKDETLHPDTCFIVRMLVKYMLFHSKSIENNIDNTEQRFHDIVETFKLLSKNLVEMRSSLLIRPQYEKQLQVFDNTFRYFTNLIYLLTETAKIKKNKELVTDLLNRLISSDIKCFLTGDSILHLCVPRLNFRRVDNFYGHEIEIFSNENVLKQLLECGANVHVKNKNGLTPLHEAMMPYNCSPQAVKLLLDFGAHLDAPNADGDTPWEAIKNLKPYDVDFADISLIKYTTLKCLCARQIVKTNISYVGQLPKVLESFVRLHDAIKPN